MKWQYIHKKSIDNGLIPIIEVFKSIEGEGSRAGFPVVFIRLAGCNMCCDYCDTRYASNPNENDIHWTSYQDLVCKVLSYGCTNVTITGGEPLLHESFIMKFCKRFESVFDINIETNGSIILDELLKMDVTLTVDCKCPSSNESMCKFASRLRERDVLKFVVADNKDLEFVQEYLYKYNTPAQKFIHPVFGEIDLKQLAQFVMDNEILELRLGIQLHKIIWDPNQRGV